MSSATGPRICTFHVAEQLFGIDVHVVQEVLVAQTVTRVPLAPEAVEGVVNLRGQIVTVIDLRGRLSLPPRAPEAEPVHVVVRNEDELVSFLVDRAGDVLDVTNAAFERPPETLEGAAGDLILGAYQLPDTLLLLLDPARAADPTPGDRSPSGRDGGDEDEEEDA